jgi:regulatory protein
LAEPGESGTTTDRLEHTLGLCYRYLNRRERTVAEVRRYLERQSVPGEAIESAISTLGEFGSLSDERFARLFVTDKRELEGWGSERIRRGLAARGIGRELIDEALSEPASPDGAGESELDRAMSVLQRHFPTPPSDRRERERALGVLLRKGYESELALDALASYAREYD